MHATTDRQDYLHVHLPELNYQLPDGTELVLSRHLAEQLVHVLVTALSRQGRPELRLDPAPPSRCPSMHPVRPGHSCDLLPDHRGWHQARWGDDLLEWPVGWGETPDPERVAAR